MLRDAVRVLADERVAPARGRDRPDRPSSPRTCRRSSPTHDILALPFPRRTAASAASC